jgi:uncharacterized protein (DUF952 family)
MLYHLALVEDWESRATEYRGSTVGRSLDDEGFVHCSTAKQLQATADRFYAGRSDVVLLTIDPKLVPAEIRIEGGFPHVYGPVPTNSVIATAPIPLGPDGRLSLAGLIEDTAGSE